jgi:hypothetical protein
MNSPAKLTPEAKGMWHAGPEGEHPADRAIDARTLLFLLAALIFLYAFLFVPPFIPIEHNIDGQIFLLPGKRMYEGEVMYRDFFQFVTPGTALVYFLLFKLLGLQPWIPDLTLLLLGLGLAWLGVMIAKKVMRPGLALLPSAIFLAGVYKNRLDPTHHWYSLLTATAAIAALMERRTLVRIATAGFFCGLTACFTQTRGFAAVVGIGVFLWWETRQKREPWRGLFKQATWLVAGFLAALTAVNAYFVWKAGLARFFWCTVVFGIKYFHKSADANFLIVTETFPQFLSLRTFLFGLVHWLFLYAVIPFTYLLFFAFYWRGSGKKPIEYWARPMLLAVVGSFMLLSVASPPSLTRMASSALPGVILLGWFIDSPGKLARTLAGVLALGVLLIVPHAVATEQYRERQILTTRPGKLAVTDPVTYEELVWIREHTRATEYFYDMMLAASESFYLNLRNPTPLPFVENDGFTTTEQVAEVVRSLKQHEVRYILLVLPEWRGAGQNGKDDHLGPLRDYVHSRYRVVKDFENSDEIWEKKD